MKDYKYIETRPLDIQAGSVYSEVIIRSDYELLCLYYTLCFKTIISIFNYLYQIIIVNRIL